MPPKSIFRQPGAKHFQLVHRSQRDPLIHDPDATAHVLKAVVRDNEKKGKTRAELEQMLAVDDESSKPSGEAALYGIYYDDSEYDYMQHLRTVGVQEDGVDSVLIEAPSSCTQSKGQKSFVTLRDLPEGVLPSSSELARTYESQQAVPDSISGFHPDMDPHLRQVLEALEDDAFVEDALEDDFFGQLVGDGERNSDDDFDFPFHEDGVSLRQDSLADPEEEDDMSWEARFARFKQTHQSSSPKSDYAEDESEGADTVSGLPNISVIGGKGKKRRKGSSEASGYSMSSSSMFRNEALQTLDERFDQVMLKQYNDDDEDDKTSMPDDSDSDSDAPELITSRVDFQSMVDEFLNDYEILGRKMKPKLAGDSGAEKLDTLRRAMGQDQRVRESYGDEDDSEEDPFPDYDEEKKDRWDCETILTTYSNLENHPRLIRARNPRPVPQIILDPKTGLPTVASQRPKVTQTAITDVETYPRQETVARPRNESPESKKARKAAVKLERASRRAEKKATKEEFGSEFKTQAKMKDSKFSMRKL